MIREAFDVVSGAFIDGHESLSTVGALFFYFSTVFDRLVLRFNPVMGSTFSYLLVAAAVHIGWRRVE